MDVRRVLVVFALVCVVLSLWPVSTGLPLLHIAVLLLALAQLG